MGVRVQVVHVEEGRVKVLTVKPLMGSRSLAATQRLIMPVQHAGARTLCLRETDT